MATQEQDYEALLDNVYEKLPKRATEKTERFEVPVAETFIQGNKTVVKNFDAICSRLRRTPQELGKYLFKELAVPGNAEGGRLILQRKLPARVINEKLDFYVKNAVLCKECGKPDTRIELTQGVPILVCEACGAREPVR